MSNAKRDSGQARMTMGSLLKFTIGWPISIIALFFIARVIFPHLQTIINNLGNINKPLLVLSIVSFISYFFVRTFVWKLILKEQGYDMPLKSASFLWEMSELKRFVPGAIWSFLAKTSLFGKLGMPTKTVFKSTLIEIEFFVLSCLFVSTLSFSFVFQKVITFVPYKPFLPSLSTAIVLLIIIIFIFSTPIANRINIRYFNTVKRLLPLFSPKTNLTILFTAIVYALFFGLGTYFATLSIAYVSPALILQLTGFFVFSLVAGFLSVIAPMGIGIREGIITIGLSKLLPLTVAGFVSIFARILLVVSELCFILFVSVWHKAKNKRIMAFENFVSLHKHELFLFFFIVAYIAYFVTASFLRYDNFYTGRFDLGNMDQTVWNTINGRIFQITDPNGTTITSRLAFHADFILILLSPLYLIWSHPKMLLLIQTVIIAIGSVFVYLLAKHAIKNKNLALVFTIAFLLNPAIQYTNLYDFHPVTLATTFLLGTFFFLHKKRYGLFLLFGVLAAITKEQVWIIMAFFGIYVFFYHKNKKILGLSTLVLSLTIFYYFIWHAIPNVLGSEHFALSYYSDFGDSPTRIVKNVLLSPHKILEIIFQKDQLSYLQQLFLPLGFLSFFYPFYLIFSLPDLLINLLSNNPSLHQIYYQYSATITPFIFIAAIFGAKNLRKWFPKLSYAFYTFYLLLSTFYSAYFFGPLPFAKNPNIDMFTKPLQDRKEIENFLSRISSQYSIAATNNIGSHLSHRQKNFTIPVGVDQADYVLFLLNDLSARPSLEFQKDLANKLNLDKDYVEVFRNGDFVAFKKVNL